MTRKAASEARPTGMTWADFRSSMQQQGARLQEYIEYIQSELQRSEWPRAAIIPLGPRASKPAMRLSLELRRQNLRVALLPSERSLKAQLKRVAKIRAPFAVIIGENEMAKNSVLLRDMRASTQREVPESEVTAAIDSRQ